jgi:carboxyl-terminal processing protease
MSLLLSPAAVAAALTSLVLIAVDLLIVLRHTIWATRKLPRWANFLSALAFALMVAQIVANMTFNFAFVIMSVPIYLATLAIGGGALVRGSVWLVRRALKRSQPAAPPRRLPRLALAALCAALVLLGALRQAQTYAYAGSIADRIALLESAPGGADFSDRSWSQAFAGLNETLKQRYPFTTWKRIDWDALYAEFSPRIADAEARQDSNAYYRALREFAWRIPDGHVGIAGDDQGLAAAEVGGGYGLTLLRLDDGRVVVSSLIADGPAAQAGIQIGAEILAWNGMAIEQALAQTPIIWSENPPATSEGRLLQQLRFLSRGSVGAQAEVAFRNRDAAAPQVARLTAIAAELDQHGDMGPAGLLRSAIESRILPSGYGYIRVNDQIPHLAGFPDDQMRQAVAGFAAQGIPGVIVDVRDNLGGESKLTAEMLAPFQPRARLYQYLGLLDPATQQFRPATSAPLLIEPRQPQYHGPLAVLVDNYSQSAAEDLALFLKDLPNTTVVGVSGTAGAGGTSETDVELPGGYTFAFPKAQSLDANFSIQIESDYAGVGGVVPDLRVQLDDAAVDTLGAGRDLVLEHAEAALHAQATAR